MITSSRLVLPIIFILATSLLSAADAPAPAAAAASAAPAATPPKAPASPAADSSPSSSATPKVSNLKPGAVLDIWLRPDNYQGGVPTDPSFVTMLDNKGIFFNMGRYADEPEMASNLGKPIIAVWTCYVHIKAGGTHMLVSEFRKNDKDLGGSWAEWHVQMTFNKQLLLDEVVKGIHPGRNTFNESRPMKLELEPGYYALQVVGWMPSHTKDQKLDYSTLTFALRDREPGALKPRDIGSTDIFYRE